MSDSLAVLLEMQISEILFLKVLAHVKEATSGKDVEEKWAYLHVAQKSII